MNLKSIFVIVLIATMKFIFSLIQKPKDHSVDSMTLLQILIGQFHSRYTFYFGILIPENDAHTETEKVKITIITTMNCSILTTWEILLHQLNNLTLSELASKLEVMSTILDLNSVGISQVDTCAAF